MALALILKRLPQGWRWLRALIILPWAVSPYGAGIFFVYLGRGQTGVGTALANRFGSSATINFTRPSSSYRIWRSGRRGTWARSWLFSSRKHGDDSAASLRSRKIDRMTPLENFLHVTLPPLRFTLFVFTCITTVLAMKTFDYIFT